MITSAEFDKNLRELSADLKDLDEVVVIYFPEYDEKGELGEEIGKAKDIIYVPDDDSEILYQREGEVHEEPLDEVLDKYDRILLGGNYSKAAEMFELFDEEDRTVFLEEDLCYG